MTDWIFIALIIVLQGADVYTTDRALKSPDNREANPLMSGLFSAFGVLPALVVVKSLLCSVLIMAALFYPSLYMTIALAVIAAGYMAVVINNFRRM